MKKQFMFASLIVLFSFTSCFPTGTEKKAEFQQSMPNNDINYSSNENIIYNFIIPDEYKKTYSITKVKLRQFDSDIAKDIFPESVKDVTNILDRPEQNNYKLFEKVGSWLCFQDGNISYFKNNNINYQFLYDLFAMPKPYAMIRDEFPEKELKTISISECTDEMDRIISTLDINVGKPKVFSITKKDSRYIEDKYYSKENISIVNEECCVINYDLLLDDVPIANYSYYMAPFEMNPLNSSIQALFTKDGMLNFNCYDVPEIMTSSDPQEMCGPEYAIAQMKEYIEKTSLKGTLYGCEQRVFIYWKEGKYTGEYDVRPVWVFGWLEKGSNRRPVPYYVDALNGHVM